MAALCIAISAAAAAQQFIPLWKPGHIPDTRRQISDSIVNYRYFQVGTPGIYVFRPAAEENTGTAVLICPGLLRPLALS